MIDEAIRIGVIILGPIPILALFQYALGDRIKPRQAPVIVFVVYAFSIITGVVVGRLEGRDLSAEDAVKRGWEMAVFGGLVAPAMSLCGLFVIFSGAGARWLSTSKPSAIEHISETPSVFTGKPATNEPVVSATGTDSSTGSWSPVVKIGDYPGYYHDYRCSHWALQKMTI